MSITLKVEKREIFGKKVKQLYRDSKVIGNLYGKGKESLPIVGDYETIRKVVDHAGKNHPIELTIEGDKNDHLVLIKHVDVDPAKGRIRHVEFHMVNRNEKVEAEVPVEIIGTAPAVLAGNIIITMNDKVVVSATPTSLPDHLEVKAELLTNPDDIILASDITMPTGVELADEHDLPLFKVEVPRSQVEAEAEEVVNAADVPAEHGDNKEEAKTEE